ncbi:MAG: helix-turn-helix domain-containing protein [Methylobacter sp.]
MDNNNDSGKTNNPTNLPDALYQLCISVTAKRARTVIDHIIKHGEITTEELSELYNYDHPPRAVRDVRENGIPLETFKVISRKTGRKIAAYRFGDPSEIVNGRIGGRKAFSKQFKEELVERYGSRSALTGEIMEPRYLQIDHRIPYEIGGDNLGENDVEDFMLLDASAQRAKSWSCENCENFRAIRDASICSSCFWAYPENYCHVAMSQERRLYLAWQDHEVPAYDRIEEVAQAGNLSPQALVKKILNAKLGGA